eukprot:4544654-Pyramimonas_sp.AAC.2
MAILRWSRGAACHRGSIQLGRPQDTAGSKAPAQLGYSLAPYPQWSARPEKDGVDGSKSSRSVSGALHLAEQPNSYQLRPASASWRRPGPPGSHFVVFWKRVI